MVFLTKKNHTNPCSWTAYWNIDYFNNKVSDFPMMMNPRKQSVFSLNMQADKVIRTNVNNVHFDKDIGIAEITPAAAKDFCRRHFPDDYNHFEKYMKNHPETLLLDFENILSSIEKSPAYETLYGVIKKQRIDTREELAFLSGFIIFQRIRSHAIFRSMLEFADLMGIERFEYFWLLKNLLGNPDYLYQLTLPLATSQWLVYKSDVHVLPLPDTPVLIKEGNVMVALSPRLLVEINLNIRDFEGLWIEKEKIPKNKQREYRKRAVENTFKEIIFNDKSILEEWRESTEFRKRRNLRINSDSFYSLVLKTKVNKLWKQK